MGSYLGIGNGFTLNTGSYYGNGVENCNSGTSGTNSRNASSTNVSRMAKNYSASYATELEAMYSLLQRGEYDRALDMRESIFEDAKETIENYGYEITDRELQSILDKAYTQVTGESLLLSVENNARSSFVNGLLEGIPVIGLFTDSTTKEEATAKITGQSTPLRDKATEITGAVLSGAASGAAIGTIFGGFGFGTTVGAIIGGAAGALRTIIMQTN